MTALSSWADESAAQTITSHQSTPPPGDGVVVVWAATKMQAEAYALIFQLDLSRVVAVGNRNHDACRGLQPAAVLIFPGATNARVEANLLLGTLTARAAGHHHWLDLRGFASGGTR